MPPSGRNNPRGGKLHSFFLRVVNGDQSLVNLQSAKLFIEAVCGQPEPVRCIESLIGSPKGLSALQIALHLDVSSATLNSSATAFLRYIQNPDIKIICAGEFLQRVLLNVVDPPAFWNALVTAQKAGQLEEGAIQSFSWLLLQLVSLPPNSASAYYEVARDLSIQRALLQSLKLEVRINGQKIKHILETVASPGHFGTNAPGGRHDNDFEDYRKIAILPTPDELVSRELPFIRRAAEIDECAEESRLPMHLDNQFRLNREDMLRDLREELQIAVGAKKGQRKGLIIDDLLLDGIECDDRRPWALRLRCFHDLPQIPKANLEQRRKYLVEHRSFLKHESLACLIADGKPAALVTINRNEDLLAHKPSVLCVSMSGGEDGLQMALLLLKSAERIQLTQLNTAVFAYEPVLRQLQNTNQLFLRDEIISWKAGNPLRTILLSCSTSFNELIRQLESNPTHDLQDLLDLPKPTKLDNWQAACLLAAIRQRLSLVQGPPGTGKSFIGALIAKAIYLFSKQTILVVCYTNHALDQFVEDLMNVNIPASSIVRLGSPKKSSLKCQPLLLSAQQSDFKFRRGDWDIIEKRRAEAKENAEQLQDAFKEYLATAVSKPELMEYLEFAVEDNLFHEAFMVPEETNDMMRVGRKGKKMDQYYLLDRWARGLDAGIFQEKFASGFPHVWQLALSQRKVKLGQWKAEIMKERISRIYNCGMQLNEALTNINALFGEKDRHVIQQKRIIACTTTAAAKHVQSIQSASPGVLLVEEVGEILESHILTALGVNTEQLILIGDHKQLRPKAHYDLSVEKNNGYDLNRSLFERLIIKQYPHQTLVQQHRMRPELSSLVRQLTYPELTDAPGTQNRPDLRGFEDNLIFVSHEHPEEEALDVPDFKDLNATSSKKNHFEAKMTLKCVRYLAQQGYGTDKIVVLTPYLAQLRLLVEVLGEENDPILNDLDSYDLVRAGLMPAATAKFQKRSLRISTIDNYQGEESDIILVSLTRGNVSHDIGFMASPERLNVLLSRARNALILIGNLTTFMDARKGKELWQKFLSLLKSGSHIHDGFPVRCERHTDRKLILRCPEDFEQCPDGGCSEPCNATLSCGLHPCPQRCHQLFDHSRMECHYALTSKCPNGHVQSWECHSKGPGTCQACYLKKKAEEKKQQDDLKHQQRLERQMQEHNARMAKLEDEIRHLREQAVENQLSKEMTQALEQKKRDLANAKRFAAQSHSSSNLPVDSQRTPSISTTALPQRSKNTSASPISAAHAESTPDVNSQAEQVQSPSEKEWIRQKQQENISNDAVDSLMAMTGLEQVKAQFLRIKARIDTTLRQNTNLSKERFGVVLLGNPGTGKTTVARLYAQFLTSSGVIPGTEFFETTGSKLASEGVATAKKHVETILNAGGGAFFLDEAYQLALGHNYGGAAILDYLLAEIENQVGKIVFIFAGYNKLMEKFFEHNPGLDSRMPYRLQFADYSDKELLQMLNHRIVKKYDHKMKIEGGSTGLYGRIVARRVGRGRGKEGFGNARALENTLSRISERQADRLHRERIAGLQPDDFLLTKEDMIGPDPSQAVISSAAWKELQSMIGLTAVKDTVRSLLDRIYTNHRRELEEKPLVEVSLNRVFLGSPGTGKTTVGKLYGQILADIGLLSSAEVVVKNPADFVGSVLGESEKNTKAILKATEGKVLIIDEAYMLHSSHGAGQSADIYKTAIVDTIVAEVQSTPGEDRCVLLLGYTEQMEDMFRNTNPGLLRRFPLVDAFNFEDFDDDQLRLILEQKLKKQGLDATKEAKDVAIDVLARARRRPHFGNAGEVENMISHAKSSYQSRELSKPLSKRSADIIFEPQDFDANFDRGTSAALNCRNLFKDIVGTDDIVNKMEGYVRAVGNLRARCIDPLDHIPFNFIFKGPPGTGKTTTARKIGHVFYDMGFLASTDVHECSATDLIAGYVGQTGIKTLQVLEKALGKVLFIDEAYRLNGGQFATEAIDELVDSLTKPRFKGKMIVVLAGYEDNMNELLSINPGLSSRFPEEVIFRNMAPEDCFTLLQNKLAQTGITVTQMGDSRLYTGVIEIFLALCNLPSWGNGRDVETLAKAITRATFQAADSSLGDFTVSMSQLTDHLNDFLAERRARVIPTNLQSPRTQRSQPMASNVSQTPPTPMKTAHSTAPRTTVLETHPAEVDKPDEVPTNADQRDVGISDAVWQQLQHDKAEQDRLQTQLLSTLEKTEATLQSATIQVETSTAEVDVLSKQAAQADAANELKRRHEEMRLKHLAALRAQQEAEDEANRVREELHRKRKEELKVQTKLREMGLCVAGFRWIKQADGYRCAGGSHFVGNGALGI